MGGPPAVLASGLDTPHTLVIHDQELYWTSFVSNGAILHMPIAGGPVTTLVPLRNQPHGLAMDANNVQLQKRGVYAALQAGRWEAHSPRTLGERVVQAVKQFAAGSSQHDDIALVGFGRTG